jgi:hypothetical protein
MSKQSVIKNEDRVLLPYEEPITSDLLLRSHILTEKIINEVRRHNDDEYGDIDAVDYWGMTTSAGFPRKRKKASDMFVQYESRTKQQKLKWLKQTQNLRSGQFYSLKNLIQNGVIAESERELFELPPCKDHYPFREIYQYHRIKRADGSEWSSTHELFTGITKTATVITLSVSDMYWYIKPTITYELGNIDGVMLPQDYNITQFDRTDFAV